MPRALKREENHYREANTLKNSEKTKYHRHAHGNTQQLLELAYQRPRSNRQITIGQHTQGLKVGRKTPLMSDLQSASCNRWRQSTD